MPTIRCIRNQPNEQAITQELVDLDLQYIPGATIENIGSADYWLRCRGADFKFIAEDEGVIVGYLSVHTLNHEGEKSVLDGTIDDSKLEGLLNLDPKPGIPVVLYMVGSVVKPAYQGKGLGLKLIDFAKTHFSIHEYSYSNMYGIAWSVGGKALLEKAGGKQIGFDASNHPVYLL